MGELKSYKGGVTRTKSFGDLQDQFTRILRGTARQIGAGVSGARLRQLEHRVNRSRDMVNAYGRNITKAQGRYVSQNAYEMPSPSVQYPRSVYAADTHFTRNPRRLGTILNEITNRSALYQRTRR